MDSATAGLFFVVFMITSMLLLQYWIIPTYVPANNQTLAIHWTLVAGNAIMILYNIYKMNPLGAAISGTMVGHNFTSFGGKRK